ncbi:MAG: endolytic transglycosylase MltG [Actinobacteria bacterium]|nr:endolytic transglycosylase MltG [Actinomycetota bacterium]
MLKKNKSINFRKFHIIISAAFVTLLLIFAVTSCFVQPAEQGKNQIPKGIEVEVEIAEGMNLAQIANLLAEKGVVDDAFVFRLFVQQKGKEKNLLPGKYRMLTGSGNEEVLNIIMAGEKVVVFKLTIPEGYNIGQTKEKILKDIPFIDAGELEAAMDIGNYYEYFGHFSQLITNLEGFLFPKTYDVTVDYTPKNIIEMLLAQYQVETQPLDWSYADEKGYTKYDILNIASLIEREAYIPEERQLISAVIHNRLSSDKTNKLLQIDATVQYALGQPGDWWPIINIPDYEFDSPYNTYIHQGLPPTPICSPGLESIKAALAPADVNYLYYVVIDENTHEHKFSETFEEHVNAINQK